MISTTSRRPSLAAVVRGEEVEVGQAVAGLVSGHSLSVKNAGAVAMLSQGPVTFQNGYCQWVFSGEGVDVHNGGAAVVFSGEGVTAERAGLGAVITGKADVQRGLVGLVIAGKVSLGEGTRVLLGIKEALVLGVVTALVLKLFGNGGRKKKSARGNKATS